MKYDPEIDEFICEHCHIERPLTYDKLKKAASIRGLILEPRMEVRGIRFVVSHPDPSQFYKTRTAAYREGLIRWILNSRHGLESTGTLVPKM